ncbi:MAG: peptide ABC transporter substrate-binding protein [Oscillospiraceae bacterium]|nr:peptide ABC transporter substrate-binding protein [Oscillospiraceae bacterium]MDD4369187.1 peptide ABC transporter substrate-binding protein [Oscillospiraceae bacterium]
MKKYLTVALAVLLAATLTACGSGASTTGTTGSGTQTDGSQAAAATTGGKISIVMTTDPDTLDPGRADDTQKNQIVLETQETLVRLIDGELTPAGAESYEQSEDGLTWTFKLRDNKYQDGTAVKAEDYVNSIRRLFDPEVNSHNAGIFYCIKGGEAFNTGTGSKEDVGAVALDDKTLQITLTEALPYFDQLLTFSNITPVPESKTQGSANASYGATAEELAQSGPFYVSEWTRGTKIVLKKNPNYWDAANIKLDEIEMPLAQDENTRQQLFDAGKIDLLSNVRSEYVTSLQSKIDAGEVQLTSAPQASMSYICFNNQDPEGVFSNAKIRMAFAIAFDREAYVNNVAKKGKAAGGLIPYGMSVGTSEYRSLYAEPMTDLLAEDAKTLLNEGLEEIGRAGETLEITFLQSNSNSDTKVIAEYYQNQWQTKLGVKVNIETASDNSAFNNQVSKGLYQVCQTGWGADYNDPMTFFQCYTTGDGNNAAFYSNSTYDELVNANKTESDMTKRADNFAEAEKILTVEDVGISPITFGYQNVVMSKNLKGVYINSAGGPAIELRDAYLEG